MKRFFPSLLLLTLCLCCLAACSPYSEGEWFGEELLDECLAPELPSVEKSFIGDGDDVYVSFSNTEFEDYARSVYDYLKAQEFEYLGTRGDQKATLGGTFTTYYFKPAEELDEFWINGHYIFVYSDGTADEYGDPSFSIIAIRNHGKTTVKLSRKRTFTYTAEISLRHGSEALLQGRYVLPDENFGHTYLSDCESWLSQLAIHSVAEVKTTSEYVGVAPGSLKDVKSTADKDVIAATIDRYARAKITPIPSEEGLISGGSALTVEFILTDGTVKRLFFNNGNYVYDGAEQSESEPLFFKVDSISALEGGEGVTECYAFVTNIGTGTVYSDGEAICEIRTDELEFVELKEKIGLPTWTMYEVEAEFGKLIFPTEDIFRIEGDDKYYRLIGENITELTARG